MDRFSALRALREGQAAIDDPPTPVTPDHRDLDVTVRCYASRTSREYATHPVTVHPDGSVDTPHDLDAERIATALGAYSSCLELVNDGIPRLLSTLPLIARRARVALHRDGRARWRIPRDRITTCCSRAAFATPADALRHLRDPWHARNSHGEPLDTLVRPLFAAAEHAWAAHRPSPPDLTELVRESGGVRELWDAGIHPDDLPAIAAAADLAGGPLPVAYFVRMRYGRVDPQWLATVLAGRPDPDFAAWLAGQDGPVPDAAETAGWLRHGTTTQEAFFAVTADLPSEAPDEIARATGWPSWLAARSLLAWTRAGCSPTPDEFALLARRSLEYHRPATAAIDALVAELRADAPRSTMSTRERTELAMLLAVLGTRRDVVHYVRTGGTLADFLDPGTSRQLEVEGVER